MTASIDIRDAFKTFGHGAQAIQALDKANLTIRPNEFVTFVGASGCGKSTLLRMIGGLESLSRGSIAVNGQPIAGPGVDRAMVFQHYSLYPWLTVIQNIKFCRQLKAHTRDRTSADVEKAAGRADAPRGGIIRRSANHLLALIDDLIDYARGASQGDALHPTPVYLHALIDAVAAAMTRPRRLCASSGSDSTNMSAPPLPSGRPWKCSSPPSAMGSTSRLIPSR